MQDAIQQERTDREQLRLLAVFHYVVGPIAMLISSIFIIHIVLGVAVVLGKVPDPPKGPPFPPIFGVIFIVMGSIAVLSGWTFGLLTIYSGYCLARQRKRILSLAVAGINCAFAPFGTVLGIFTLLVLSRPSVVKLYEAPDERPLLGAPPA